MLPGEKGFQLHLKDPGVLLLGLVSFRIIDTCLAFSLFHMLQGMSWIIVCLTPHVICGILNLGGTELLVVLAPFITRQLNLLSFNYEGTVKSIESFINNQIFFIFFIIF